MRSEDAVEIVRAALALALPTASAEGLTRAAETLIRWGSEDVAQHLDGPLTDRLILDLLEVAGEYGAREVQRATFRPAEERYLDEDTAAGFRTWSRTEGMRPLPYLARPPEEPRRPDGPDGPPYSRGTTP